MADLFAVGVNAGVPNTGTGTAWTLNNLATAGVGIQDGAGNKASVVATTASSTNFALAVTLSPNGLLVPGQATMATSTPTAIASDQTVVPTLQSVRATSGTQGTTVLGIKGVNVVTIATTTETVIATAISGKFIDIYGLILANTSATAALFTVKDVTAGTTKAVFYCPAGDTRGYMLPEGGAITAAATNTNWTGTLGTSISGITATVLYVKN